MKNCNKIKGILPRSSCKRKYRYAQSLFDFLIDIMPELGDGNISLLIKQRNNNRDPNSQKLYSLWTDTESKISERKFRRPPNMTEADIKNLEDIGFLQVQGKELKVTAKGVEIIREMILDDDHSFFDKKSSSETMTKTASRDVNTLKNSYTVLNNWYKNVKRM